MSRCKSEIEYCCAVFAKISFSSCVRSAHAGERLTIFSPLTLCLVLVSFVSVVGFAQQLHQQFVFSLGFCFQAQSLSIMPVELNER